MFCFSINRLLRMIHCYSDGRILRMAGNQGSKTDDSQFHGAKAEIGSAISTLADRFGASCCEACSTASN
jgi:hypothetical protein